MEDTEVEKRYKQIDEEIKQRNKASKRKIEDKKINDLIAMIFKEVK